jgi:hypothetical protein
MDYQKIENVIIIHQNYLNERVKASLNFRICNEKLMSVVEQILILFERIKCNGDSRYSYSHSH